MDLDSGDCMVWKFGVRKKLYRAMKSHPLGNLGAKKSYLKWIAFIR